MNSARVGVLFRHHKPESRFPHPAIGSTKKQKPHNYMGLLLENIHSNGCQINPVIHPLRH